MRDSVSERVVLALVVSSGPRLLGIVFLIDAMIPAGDRMLISAARGSISSALGIHGTTGLLMIAAAIPLTSGIG